ncbi:helix-turn-helix domain-containing protein [Olleya sp. Bg11-27]|uniref:helix-turn-helix domain-containing protein n=1 Tax=Olleya sp. Bg11-27 TaxID=2058135 RepID=UPI000C318EF8|nr:helix-turn-helix domain-containing protein [Olleya sp. Bg11-27]AUC77311.1 AraC family transcriptional regulator [Olleya sp. Bg11-27]
MLKTLQIIALLQGLFVLSVLFVNRKDYKKTTFWLLFGSLLSVLFYILGDDENNLFVQQADWFLFDSSLFVTFLFLFFRYYKNGKEKFAKLDYLLFLPNIIYFIIEGFEILMIKEHFLVEIFEILSELTFVVYLWLIVYSILTTKKKHWIIYFAIPIVVLFALSSLNDILQAFGLNEIPMFNDQNFNTYLLLVVAFLFYFIAFKLLNKSKSILPKIETSKYKNSNLNTKLIDKYKIDLISVMEFDKLYLNGKLSIHDVSEKLNIPRQYISEVLNEHMHTSFQDFVNQYRVEEFINRLQNDQNDHLTLLGIATDVGFNSKSSFNATFKKFKGLTPTEFKKNMA